MMLHGLSTPQGEAGFLSISVSCSPDERNCLMCIPRSLLLVIAVTGPVAIGALLPAPVGADEHWPAFRGNSHLGVAESKTLPVTWDTSKNVLWKAEVPGRGWSSPIVWGERVFLTTCISDEKQADPRKGLYIGDLQGKVPPGEQQWIVLCLDAR